MGSRVLPSSGAGSPQPEGGRTRKKITKAGQTWRGLFVPSRRAAGFASTSKKTLGVCVPEQHRTTRMTPRSAETWLGARPPCYQGGDPGGRSLVNANELLARKSKCTNEMGGVFQGRTGYEALLHTAQCIEHAQRKRSFPRVARRRVRGPLLKILTRA